jgi:hypothetical protein
MLSRRDEDTRVLPLPDVPAPKQFARHTFARHESFAECLMKVFNSSVEIRVEKARLRFEIPRGS